VITNITDGLNNYEIPTSSLEKGIYYLSVEQSGTVNKIQTKFIKE
jgi:hypothetical protein